MSENTEALPGQPDVARARTNPDGQFSAVFNPAMAQQYGQPVMQPFSPFTPVMPPIVVDPSIWANNMNVLPIAQTASHVHPGMEGKPIVGLSYYGDYTIPTYLIEVSSAQPLSAVQPKAGTKSVQKKEAKPVEKIKCTQDNCKKKAVDGTKLCYAHGGRMRCRQEGCTRAARGCYKFCRYGIQGEEDYEHLFTSGII